MTLRLPDLRAAMDEVLTRQVATGAALYRREIHLAPLIGEWHHLTDAEIVTRLEVKLRSWQRLTLATGHWAGDINRVIALKQALEGERRK